MREESDMAYAEEGAGNPRDDEPRDRSELDNALRQLEDQVKRMHELRERLSTVLRPEGAEKAMPDGPSPEPYRISERVRSATNGIGHVISDVLDRLEL